MQCYGNTGGGMEEGFITAVGKRKQSVNNHF